MDGQMHSVFYESIGELLEDVKDRPDFKLDANKNTWEHTAEADDDFHGNFEKVYDKYKKHNVKREASVIAGIMDEINCADFEERAWEFKQRLEEGDIIDVNRYLDGHEKFWCGVKRAWRAKQVVRIYCGVGGNCGRSKEELAVCGAAAVTLCEILESMGVGVELWGVSPASRLFTNGDHGITLTKMKSSDEFADLGMINYYSGDHHMFRNAVFRSWIKMGERDGLKCDSCLGCTRKLSAEDIGLSEEEANASIIMPHMYDVETAKQWLINLIKGMPEKLGGKKQKED